MKRKRRIKIEDLITDDEETIHEVEKEIVLYDIDHPEEDHILSSLIKDEDSDEDVDEDEDEELDDDEEALEDIVDEEEKPVKAARKYKIKKPDKAKFYIQPKEFDDEIIKYYNTGVMSDELALMVEKIANKLSFSPNFINYSYKDDMIGDAVVKMMKALIGKKYQHDKGSNPFSYFTRIAFNSFICRIKKEKHTQETHEKYRDELLMFADNYNTITKNRNVRIIPEN